MTDEENKNRNKSAEKGRIKWIKDNCLRDCSGNDDYLFISYKSDDWREVWEGTVYELCRKYGLKVYFDTSFDKHKEGWIGQMKENMCNEKCKGIISFQSTAYYTSSACLLEMMIATTNKAGNHYDPNEDINNIIYLNDRYNKQEGKFEKFYIPVSGKGVTQIDANVRKEHSGLGLATFWNPDPTENETYPYASTELNEFIYYLKYIKQHGKNNGKSKYSNDNGLLDLDELFNFDDYKTTNMIGENAYNSNDYLTKGQCYNLMNVLLNNINETQHGFTNFSIDTIKERIQEYLPNIFPQDWDEKKHEILPTIDELLAAEKAKNSSNTTNAAASPAIIPRKVYDISKPEDAQTLLDKLYARFKKDFNNNAEEALNFTIRWVFILYAVDTEIIPKNTLKKLFYSENVFSEESIDLNFERLFKLVCSDGQLDNQKDEKLFNVKDNNYDEYNIGGDFFSSYDSIKQPENFKDPKLIKDSIEAKNWKKIDPAIFSEMFVGILSSDEVHKNGVHYTSKENISKVIDPLFLDALKNEFEKIKETKKDKLSQKDRKQIKDFLNKLGKIKILDPASGCGNFLIRAYLSLREIENEALGILYPAGEMSLEGTEEDIKVLLNNFYGIEIDDRAAKISKLAMLIAEHQMFTKSIKYGKKFLPLNKYNGITVGNALTLDWENVVSSKELSYIIGNPPFIGASLMSDEQKADVYAIFDGVKNNGNLDYVSCWYKKAANMMTGTSIKAALVSTNSITQGEQVAILWKNLFENGIHIDFAYKTFEWIGGDTVNAHVYCVIVGFSVENNNALKYLFDNGIKKIVKNINGYLVEAENIFIESRSKPICKCTQMVYGSKPTDDGNFFLNYSEMTEIIKKEPDISKYILRFLGAEEFINNKKRYCLWLTNASPSIIKKSKFLSERVNKTRAFRLQSTKAATRKSADTPHLFQEIRQSSSTYILVPAHTGGNRKYIPMGFEEKDTICGNANLSIPNATMYEFGVLTSNVHMAWTRSVCGYLGTSYRYSANIVYNNFPWCTPTPEQKAKIEQTAQAILDARALYPDKSLAFLYDPDTMPTELRKAHDENDAAVMELYGFSPETSESDIVKKLFEMYAELVEKQEQSEGKLIDKDVITDNKSALKNVEFEFDSKIEKNALTNNEGENNSKKSVEKVQKDKNNAISPENVSGDTYTICGKTSSGNQSKMMVDVLKHIIEKHFDMLDSIAANLTSVAIGSISEQKAKGVTYFSVGSEFTYKGTTYSIGTSYGQDAKLAQIRKAIMLTGENPHDYVINGLFDEKQMKKAEESYSEANKSTAKSNKSKTVKEEKHAGVNVSELASLYENNDSLCQDVLCCFLSKYSDDAVQMLGFTSTNKVFESYSEKLDSKPSTLKNIRDTFDPFFDNGRAGWWQKKDKISERRKKIIDVFTACNTIDDAYSFVCSVISK